MAWISSQRTEDVCLEKVWMPIEFPAPPEKEMHSCSKRSCAGSFFCDELPTGYLELTHDFGSVIVNYCPFCGFTLEQK